MCYISCVKHLKLVVPLLLILSAGCGKNINKQVQDAVRNFDNLGLTDKEIEVLSTQEMSGNAIAELKIRTAVKLVKKQGIWVVDEVRIGDRRWEKAEHILAVINQKRAETTRNMLEAIGSGIDRYTAANGRLPQGPGFRELVSVLSPDYLGDPALLDAWANPFSYRLLGNADYEVRSAGADGRTGTPDDIVKRAPSGGKREAVQQK